MLALGCAAVGMVLATVGGCVLAGRSSSGDAGPASVSTVWVAAVVAIGLVAVPFGFHYLVDGSQLTVEKRFGWSLLLANMSLLGIFVQTVICAGFALVVFARLRSTEDRAVVDYFGGRELWLAVAICAVLALTLLVTGMWLTEEYFNVPQWLRSEPGLAHSPWVYAPVFLAVAVCSTVGARVSRSRPLFLASVAAAAFAGFALVAVLFVSVLAAANPGPLRVTPAWIGSVGAYYGVQLTGSVAIAVGFPMLAAAVVNRLATGKAEGEFGGADSNDDPRK